MMHGILTLFGMSDTRVLKSAGYQGKSFSDDALDSFI